MKHILISIIFTYLGLTLFAQQKGTYQLNLSPIEIDYRGIKEKREPITVSLTPNEEQNISIYAKDGHVYFLNARILVRGNRIKLRMQNFIITEEGKTIKGKYRKYVHYLKVGINNNFEGNGTESLLINAEQMLAINAIYKFNLSYLK
jgi:hypothetical protein